MEVKHLIADGFPAAIRGMRNPLNSWDKSDSGYSITHLVDENNNDTVIQEFTIGPNDMNLAQRLIKGGPEHAKYLRQINVSMDITAPLYWWKEFDTYKVGTTANSTSTMHRLTAKEFTKEDFSCDKLIDYTDDKEVGIYGKMTKPTDFFDFILKYLNYYRDLYNETKKEEYWWQINQVLPLSYNQTRTVTMNYAVLRNIIKQRKNHRLPEWHKFIEEMHKLPYAEELIFYNL